MRRAHNDWGYEGNTPRTESQYRSLAEATKLRCLSDMSEREIRTLERLYGAKIVRPTRRPKQKVKVRK